MFNVPERCNIFSEIKDRTSQNFEAQRKMDTSGTNSKQN